MRTALLALLAFTLAGSGALAGERSFGFVHIDGRGGVSQSLSSRHGQDDVAVSGMSYGGGSYRDDRDDRHDSDRRRLEERYSDHRWRDGERRNRGFHDIDRGDARFHPRGSFLYISHATDAADRPYIPALDDIAYGGSGTYDIDDYRRASGGNGGYVDGTEPASFPSTPRIINIEAERLDRHPIGPSGIEVTNKGGAKIIRIAPGYSSTGRRQASAEPAAQPARAYLQPWSEAWMKHCIAAYPSFDPELGTYADRGKIRFCTTDE